MFWGRRRFNRTVSGGAADELIKCAREGKPLTYSPARAVPGLDEVPELGGHRTLDAATVRDLLTGGLHSDPRGIQIRGAYLRGPLDLDGVRSTTGLRFTGCRFDQPSSARDAVLPWLHLDGCVLPGIVASRARIGTLRVTGCRIEANSQDGAVQLDGAHIRHELNMSGTSITNNSGAALAGAALNVGDGMCTGVLLDGLRAAGRAGRSGTVRLAGARIGGDLLLRGAWLTNATGPALVADGIRVSGDTRLGRSAASGTEFQATGAASTGTVLLRGAALAGDLALHGARVKSVASAGPGRPGGPAGFVPGAAPGLAAGAVPGAVPGLAPGAGLGPGASPGALCLTGSTIRRDLVLQDTALVNSTGPALAADRVRIGGSALLDPGFLAHGERQDGAVRLARAKIGGDLRLGGARLASGTGPALLADGLTVHGDLMLVPAGSPGPACTAAGAGAAGTIMLRGCTVGGSLSLDGAVIEHGGPAAAGPDLAGDQIRAAGARIRREITGGHPARRAVIAGLLRGGQPDGGQPDGGQPEGRQPEGRQPDGGAWPAQPPSLGAICLDGSTVSGPLVLGRALLRSRTGPALRAARLVARSGLAGRLQGGHGLTAIGAGPDGAVCLAGADITGDLALPGATLVNTTGPALAARAARIDGDLRLDQDVVAAGAGPAGAVAVDGAVVGQVLSCSGWFTCLPPDGPPGAVARGPALDLGQASVGTLRLGGRRPAGFAADGGFRLDGLSYSGLPVLGDPELLSPRPRPGRRPPRWRGRPGRAGDPAPDQVAVAQWLSWFRHETAEHAGQPYAALAAAYQAAGHGDLARAILVAQRDDARARAAAGPARRLGQHAARWLTGYGYRSWYALLWLAGMLAATIGLAVFWFGPARYIQPTAAARPPVPVASPVSSPVASPVSSPVASGARSAGGPHRAGLATAARPAECGMTGRVGYAVGLVLPFTGPGGGPAGPCAVPAASAAPGVLAFGWLVRVLAVALLVVYLVSLTGLTRSPPRSG